MERLTFKTQGVCSTHIDIDTQDGIVVNVVFNGGCNGNAKGISAMVRGCKIVDVIDRLEGISCKGKDTSCPDQFAKALKAIIKSNH